MKKMEMEEKIRKRQERFGVIDTKKEDKPKVIVNVIDEKMKKRAERFGLAV